ncbi:unannotated protein [freshwater metagenome]|uniref:Unannotated protein n=1 Tax=freshwater metagenome TaxID=449393 RepID=A0A6J7JSC4_9ZZZZ
MDSLVYGDDATVPILVTSRNAELRLGLGESTGDVEAGDV